MLEKLSLSHLQSHINASGKFCPYQSAYRPGYSTQTALLKVVNNISCAAGSGKYTALLALDISAAFDVLCHHISSYIFDVSRLTLVSPELLITG